ncbi:MAG: hypothetical protein KDE34_16040 [Anaerolineales bacterium]|nr:hypothetical protein [Anaerolineales bacterium]
MRRFLFLLLTLFSAYHLVGCTSAASENIPTPTAATTLPPPTAEPTAPPTSTLPPTNTAVAPTETPTPAPIFEMVDDCTLLQPPLLTLPVSDGIRFVDPLSLAECQMVFLGNGRFDFANLWHDNQVYGVLYESADTISLVQLGVDGSHTELLSFAGNFHTGNILISPGGESLAWAAGGGRDDRFVASLWLATTAGDDPHVVYEVETALTELMLQIIYPIGFDTSGRILFSLEPNGRGGGWIYSGEYSNLYRLDPASGAVEELFSCTEATGPFCINDFTADFAQLAYTNVSQQAIVIYDLVQQTTQQTVVVDSHSFIGRPYFGPNDELAFMAVDVVQEGSQLEPKNGQLGLLAPPYDGPVQWLTTERINEFHGWLDGDNLLYSELLTVPDIVLLVINRDGEIRNEFRPETSSVRLLPAAP